jgi:hypothetical protein
MNKIAKRDDPFSNANLLVFLIFAVVVQKYVIESIFTMLLMDKKADQTTIVVIR